MLRKGWLCRQEVETMALTWWLPSLPGSFCFLSLPSPTLPVLAPSRVSRDGPRGSVLQQKRGGIRTQAVMGSSLGPVPQPP